MSTTDSVLRFITAGSVEDGNCAAGNGVAGCGAVVAGCWANVIADENNTPKTIDFLIMVD